MTNDAPSDHTTPDLAIAALQLELTVLMEELEGLTVGPLPRGSSGLREATRLARVGQDISTLSMACEVLRRRAGNLL